VRFRYGALAFLLCVAACDNSPTVFPIYEPCTTELRIDPSRVISIAVGAQQTYTMSTSCTEPTFDHMVLWSSLDSSIAMPVSITEKSAVVVGLRPGITGIYGRMRRDPTMRLSVQVAVIPQVCPLSITLSPTIGTTTPDVPIDYMMRAGCSPGRVVVWSSSDTARVRITTLTDSTARISAAVRGTYRIDAWMRNDTTKRIFGTLQVN
jgi:hypothetical protein